MALDMADSSINFQGLKRETYQVLNQSTQDLAVSSNTSPIKRDSKLPLSYYTSDLEQKNLLDKALSTFTYVEDSIYQGYNKTKKEECFPCTCKVYLDANGSKVGCDDFSDCINRLLLVECKKGTCPTGKYCHNQRFQRKQNAKINLTLTEKKGYGILAAEDIEKGGFVMEYVGEVIGQSTFIQRTEAYNDTKAKHFYFMSLKSDKIIDATSYGSLARFINHSCNPNCILQKWMVGPNLCIGIFTIRPVRAGEEITFDYKFERYGALPQACYCGESNCKGVLGSEKQSELRGTEGLTEDPESILAFKGLETDQDCSEVVKLMLQLSQNPEMALVLLKKIGNTEDERLLKKIVRLHGVITLKAWLEDYSDNKDISMEILSLFEKFPFSFKNKLEDLDIYGCLRTFGEANPNEKERIEKLISGWEKLPRKYIIPRLAQLSSKAGSDSPPVDIDSPRCNRLADGSLTSTSTPAISSKDQPFKNLERGSRSPVVPNWPSHFSNRTGSLDIGSSKEYQPYNPSKLNGLYSPTGCGNVISKKTSTTLFDEKDALAVAEFHDSKIKSILEKITKKNQLDSTDSGPPNAKQMRIRSPIPLPQSSQQSQSKGLLVNTEPPKTSGFVPASNPQLTQPLIPQSLGLAPNGVPINTLQPRNGININLPTVSQGIQHHIYVGPPNGVPPPAWMQPRPFMAHNNSSHLAPSLYEANPYGYHIPPNFPKLPMGMYANNMVPASYAPMAPNPGYIPAAANYSISYPGENQLPPMQAHLNPSSFSRSIANALPFMNKDQQPIPTSVNTFPPPGSNLPPNWRFAHAPSGQLYYYNAITQETSWDRPILPNAPQINSSTQKLDPESFARIQRLENANYPLSNTGINGNLTNYLSNNVGLHDPSKAFNDLTKFPTSLRMGGGHQTQPTTLTNPTSSASHTGKTGSQKQSSSGSKALSLEELEARCTKLFSIEVVNIFSRFKHEFSKDVFKKHAAKMTHLLVDKEKRLSSFMNGKLHKMTPELRKRIKDFTIDYAEKLVEKKKLYEASKA